MEEATAANRKALVEEDLSVEAVVLESQAVVLHLERVVEASVHLQVDLEVIKDLNQEAVFR